MVTTNPHAIERQLRFYIFFSVQCRQSFRNCMLVIAGEYQFVNLTQAIACGLVVTFDPTLPCGLSA